MSDKDSPSGPEAEPGREAPRKWEKPRIESGQLFETASLSCGKTPSTGTFACQVQNPTNS